MPASLNINYFRCDGTAAGVEGVEGGHGWPLLPIPPLGDEPAEADNQVPHRVAISLPAINLSKPCQCQLFIFKVTLNMLSSYLN